MQRMAHRLRFVPKSVVARWHRRCGIIHMLNWRRAEELFAESVREVGVLIVVFAPLDAAFSELPVNTVLVATWTFTGFLFAAIGIIFGARR